MHYLYEYETPGSQLFITFLDGLKSALEKKRNRTYACKNNDRNRQRRWDEAGIREREMPVIKSGHLKMIKFGPFYEFEWPNNNFYSFPNKLSDTKLQI